MALFLVLLLLVVCCCLGFAVLIGLNGSDLQRLTVFLGWCFPRTSSLVSFYKNRRRLLSWYTELLTESSTMTIVVQRFGVPRTVVTANPENVEYILKTNFVNFPKGRPFTDLLGDFLGVGIFNVDGEMWRKQRKVASHGFTSRCLRGFFSEVLEKEVEERLIPILEEAAGNGRVLDLQDILRRFAFDLICKVSLGMEAFCLDLSRPPPPITNAFDAASAISAMRGVSSTWRIKRALNVGREKELKEAVRVVNVYVEEMMRLKKEMMKLNGGAGGGDLLSEFLKSGFSDEVVRDMVVSFLMAGRDTTSAAMTWLFWLLTCHRKIENDVVEEVTTITAGGRIGFDDLRKMNLIKACLSESMRLYPPVVWDSKHAENDDVLPDGTPIRKGDRVTYFPYGMGRMEKVWGEKRLEFIPSRWFAENSGGLKKVSPYKFPCFQAGPRECLGKEMAFVQMKYVVATVLPRFVITPVSSQTPDFVPLLTACMAGGFNVRVRRRLNEKEDFVAAFS